MQNLLDRAHHFFEIPINLRSRILILLAALLLVPTFFLPLWKMSLYSNQFPDGLSLRIYSYKLEGRVTPLRNDLEEINSLNHYIGMRPLREDDFTEFRWIPFVVGAIVLLSFRVAVLGKMSKLVDLLVLLSYFGLFSLWSFYHKLYLYGHDLDPTAAVTVDPFTPPLFGYKRMANFDIYNYPDVGSLFMAAAPFILLIAIYLSWRSGRKKGSLAG
jgi:hypothetical protein